MNQLRKLIDLAKFLHLQRVQRFPIHAGRKLMSPPRGLPQLSRTWCWSTVVTGLPARSDPLAEPILTARQPP